MRECVSTSPEAARCKRTFLASFERRRLCKIANDVAPEAEQSATSTSPRLICEIAAPHKRGFCRLDFSSPTLPTILLHPPPLSHSPPKSPLSSFSFSSFNNLFPTLSPRVFPFTPFSISCPIIVSPFRPFSPRYSSRSVFFSRFNHLTICFSPLLSREPSQFSLLSIFSSLCATLPYTHVHPAQLFHVSWQYFIFVPPSELLRAGLHPASDPFAAGRRLDKEGTARKCKRRTRVVSRLHALHAGVRESRKSL